MATTDNQPPSATSPIARAVGLALAHLATHTLPEPWSLHLTTGRVQVQLRTDRCLPAVAAAILAWAATLPTAALSVWRPPHGHTVHLELDATLTGPHGDITLHVYGGTDFDPAMFAGLPPGQSHPVTPGQAADWARTGTEVAA